MMKATKRKTNKKNNNRTGIFDFDSEVSGVNEIDNEKRKTRKITKKTNIKKNKNGREKKENLKKINDSSGKKNNKKTQQKNNQKIQKKNARTIRQKQIEGKQKENERVSWQQMKRIKRINKTIKCSFIVLILCCLIVLLALSPIFNIKEISIQKNQIISNESIMGILNIKKDTNIFKENNKTIKEKLKENPYINIDKTTIRRVLPSTLIISISERNVEYLLELGNVYAYIDSEGNILEISSQSIAGKMKINGYTTSIDNIKEGNKLTEKDIEKIKQITQIIKVAKNMEIYDKITSINIKDSDDYILYMENEKKNVHVGNIDSLDTKMLYVKAILEKEKENEGEIFVNVDLNNKNAYFKQNV